MTIRKSTIEDIDLILRMYDHSRSVMRADGNMTQWVGYPTRKDVEEDIAQEVSYIIEESEGEHGSAKACGTFAMVPGVEPTYGYIDHGRWIDEQTPYTTLHRMAAMPGAHGIADIAFRYAKELCDHLRVDTHHDNRPMHHILEKEGFVYCGIIYMPDGAPRDAYEWWRYDSVPADLKEYVEKEILPRHEKYDAAHRPDHIRRVIARAMTEGERFKVKGERYADANQGFHLSPLTSHLIYAAASMHDIGICEGREVHHLASGRIIRADQNLRRWFSEEEIELIAQAAEDHRASATIEATLPAGMHPLRGRPRHRARDHRAPHRGVWPQPLPRAGPRGALAAHPRPPAREIRRRRIHKTLDGRQPQRRTPGRPPRPHPRRSPAASPLRHPFRHPLQQQSTSIIL